MGDSSSLHGGLFAGKSCSPDVRGATRNGGPFLYNPQGPPPQGGDRCKPDAPRKRSGAHGTRKCTPSIPPTGLYDQLRETMGIGESIRTTKFHTILGYCHPNKSSAAMQ